MPQISTYPRDPFYKIHNNVAASSQSQADVSQTTMPDSRPLLWTVGLSIPPIQSRPTSVNRLDSPHKFRPNRVILDGSELQIASPSTNTYRVEPENSSLINFSIVVRTPRDLTGAASPTLTPRITAFTEALNYIQSTTFTAQTHEGVMPPWIVNTSLSPVSPALAIATPWCGNGDILTFVRRSPSENKAALILQVATGLQHLHTNGVIHGNLSPSNILIMDNLNAYITDVGVNALVRLILREDDIPEAWPYKAPEELFPWTSFSEGTFKFTKAMDLYSFACVVYAVYAGRAPFCVPAIAGIFRIRHFGHTHLRKPPRMGDRLWDVLRKCWSLNPDARPTITQVVAELLLVE